MRQISDNIDMTIKRVAIQGERGAFSEVAAREMISSRFTLKPCESFEELFGAVKSGQVQLGVIPIENSLIGTISMSTDLLLANDLKIVGETQIRVVHCLIAPKDIKLRQIKKIYSHPAALDQCRKFFKTHPTKQPIPYYDTAGAVKMLAESDMKDSAAIASPYAADVYGMNKLKQSIEDEKFNFTRFFLLSKRTVPFKGRAKTSIVFSLKNKPGALFKALSVFALRDIDLTKIESRPARTKAWAYNFFADFIGSPEEDRVKCALDHLGEITHFVKLLGCYPYNVKS